MRGCTYATKSLYIQIPATAADKAYILDAAVMNREGLNIASRLGHGSAGQTWIMRKRLITPTPDTIRANGEGWLDVERSAVVEVTSEDKDFPVDLAFASRDTRGWRAAVPGSQTIRLIFDQPQQLSCISLIFEENEAGRTQEFVLRWSSNGESSLKEIVRQQWNFSPPESTREVEEYRVELSNVTVLELIIKPNIGGGVARASLKSLRLS